jgi:hypothetical protein
MASQNIVQLKPQISRKANSEGETRTDLFQWFRRFKNVPWARSGIHKATKDFAIPSK